MQGSKWSWVVAVGLTTIPSLARANPPMTGGSGTTQAGAIVHPAPQPVMIPGVIPFLRPEEDSVSSQTNWSIMTMHHDAIANGMQNSTSTPQPNAHSAAARTSGMAQRMGAMRSTVPSDAPQPTPGSPSASVVLRAKTQTEASVQASGLKAATAAHAPTGGGPQRVLDMRPLAKPSLGATGAAVESHPNNATTMRTAVTRTVATPRGEVGRAMSVSAGRVATESGTHPSTSRPTLRKSTRVTKTVRP